MPLTSTITPTYYLSEIKFLLKMWDLSDSFLSLALWPADTCLHKKREAGTCGVMNINFIQTVNTFKFVVWVFYILGSNYETWVTSLCLTGCLLKLANRFSDMKVLISRVRKRVERAFGITLTKSQALFGTLGSFSCQHYKKQTFLTSVYNTNTHKCHLMTLRKQCSVGLDHTINLQQTNYGGW